MSREQRVEKILGAAREAFCEHGYDGTAVAAIAERTGVVEANVYKYFGSKRELLLKVLDDWYEGMFRDYAAALTGVRRTRERVHLLVRLHLQSIKDHPQLCRLMFREVRSEQNYPGSGLHAQNRRYTQLLVEVLREGIKSGELRSDVAPALLRDLVYGGIEHHAWGYLCGRGSLNPQSLADDIVALVLDGAAKELRK